ncbi:MAG: hypothetical protein AAF567_04720 [Actinomycetota bacterium]
MPFYHALVRPDLLTEELREQFSGDVVDVHCGVTGAPRSFVHLLVTEDTGERLPEGQNALVSGTIRAGRTDAQKAEIADGMSAALAARAGIDAGSVAVTTRDIEASFTMEGGALLPEPGSAEEEAWKAMA